jgi:hypothetical protein
MGRRISELPHDILDLLHRGEEGVIDSRSAVAAGVSRSRLHRLVEAGLLTSLGSSCFADAARIKQLTPWELHGEKARAFALSRADSYLTGWSAAVRWGLRTAGSPPRLPTLVRPLEVGRGSTMTPNGRILVARVPNEHLLVNERLGMVSTAWATVDLARTAPVHHALIAADSAARKGADLNSALSFMGRGWAGIERARWVVRQADPNSESAIETLGRFTPIQFNLPVPVANAWVGDHRPRKRVDGLWPFHRVAGEADGAVKYNDRPDAARIMQRQSDRDFYLRRLGLDVVHYGWDEAYHRRRELAGRFDAVLRDNPAGEPIRWWKHVPGVGAVEPEPEDWPSPYPLDLVLPAGWGDELDPLRRPIGGDCSVDAHYSVVLDV